MNDFSAISCAISLLSHTILSVVELVAILLRACFTVVYWCLWWLCWVHILLTVAVVVLFSWQLHTTACHLDKFKLRSFGVNTFIRYQAYLLQSCGTALPKSQMSVKCQIHPHVTSDDTQALSFLSSSASWSSSDGWPKLLSAEVSLHLLPNTRQKNCQL